MRNADIVVMSDLHIGTFGFHAEETLKYLNSINPETLILNGDIIDMWNFKKRYFPDLHLEVLKRIIQLSQNGTKVYYLTGNHDDLLRRFSDTLFGNIELLDKLVLNIDNEKYWFFHGDVFDASIQHAKWIAKLGGHGYDMLIRINRVINIVLNKFNKPAMSFAGKIKNNVKNAVKFISDFEQTAAELAIENKYEYVVCGHIHQPSLRTITNEHGSVKYMNSGDWVESLTSLEYDGSKWALYTYNQEDFVDVKTKAAKISVPKELLELELI